MTCHDCGQQFSGARCGCGSRMPVERTELPQDGFRSVVSRKTGIRYYLCTWSHGCNMPCTTMAECAGSILCRWHALCRDAPDQAGNVEVFAAWLERMQEAYPSRGWWGAPLDLLWPVLMGTNLMPEDRTMGPAMIGGGFLTREQFGHDLYEAVKAAASRQQALQNAQMYARKGLSGQAALEEKRAQGYFQDLEAIVSKETIAPKDLSRLMQQYGC